MAKIIAALRSAVVPRAGAFSNLSLQELAAPVIQSVIGKAGVEIDQVDELIVSNALGAGGNPARLCALAAGLPVCVAGLSIDRQCVGGLDAIIRAADMVDAGRARVVVAGGAESYSRRPLRMHSNHGADIGVAYDRPAFVPEPAFDLIHILQWHQWLRVMRFPATRKRLMHSNHIRMRWTQRIILLMRSLKLRG